MDKMLNPSSRRTVLSRPRPRTVLLVFLAFVTAYFLVFSGPTPNLHAVPYLHGDDNKQEDPSKGDTPTNVHTNDEVIAPKEPVEPVAPVEPVTPVESIAPSEPEQTIPKEKPVWDVEVESLSNWREDGDGENYDDAEPGYETDGKDREAGQIAGLRHEKDMRKLWRYGYKMTANLPTSNLIYGNTIATLDYKDNRTQVADERLREDPEAESSYSNEKPVRFNPYPDYNSDEWKDQGYAPYVPCKGSTGEFIEDLLVFKGRPQKWPKEKIGTYSALQLDPNLCWERDTRLGPYGLTEQKKKIGGEYKVIDWDNVNWGDLQRRCVHKNAKRYDLNRSRKNPFLVAYPETAKLAEMSASAASSSLSKGNPAKGIVASSDPSTADALNRENIEEYGAGNLVDSDLLHDTKPHRRSADQPSEPRLDSASTVEEDQDAESTTSTPTGFVPEKRTALLLRSYTGKEFTDNDKQVIRALVSELSLKSGGEYEVFLLTHVKDPQLRIFDDPETYQYVLQENVPPEFHGMTVLWNDEVVWNIYTELTDENEKSVHTAQWLSVQKFSHDHPQFDFIWNWEMDFRYIGHHYDLLEALGKFAAKQPRRGLWERNERYYVPEFHGGYDTDYRKFVEKQVGEKTVWGPPKDLPFINPVGPKAPVADPGDDNYEWGVGEDADVITVGPIFNPIHSNWIIGNHIWGYNDSTHDSLDIPRRTTIVTQSRVSKRLLDIMHVENKRGNHVASEMTPQTVALLHGLKAVFAPHPVFMDRDWDGEFVEKWFNGGENGTCSGRGSPMGWGRERRYQGTTWYYRAEPPNRLYNNWMGWSDTDIGGKSWEEKNGRPCLPSVMLHQIKNTEPTEKDHRTGFDLTFG